MPEAAVAVGVLGLGEAGTAIARDLVEAGASVRAYDPLLATGAVVAPEGVAVCGNERSAAEGSELVLSVNSAHDALGALEAGIAGTDPTTVWADLNTAPARLKEQLQARCSAAGRAFADVAMMSPVPGRGVRTPMLVSGDGALRFSQLMAPLGTPIDVLDGPAGLAATKKLLRSVFYKGLAAAVVEALKAADAAGQGEWLREHIRGELDAADAALLDRLVEGSVRHALRRGDEMRAAASLLEGLGVPPHVATASAAVLDDLRLAPRA